MKKTITLFIICVSITLTGCYPDYPDLSDNDIAFNTGKIIEFDNEESSLSIEYNNRTYIAYGTINNYYNRGKINKCLGYIIQNEDNSSIIDLNNKDTRVFTLIDDPDNNYLLIHYIKTNLMNQPIIFRALDTHGININTPKYIESLDYNFWK